MRVECKEDRFLTVAARRRSMKPEPSDTTETVLGQFSEHENARLWFRMRLMAMARAVRTSDAALMR